MHENIFAVSFAQLDIVKTVIRSVNDRAIHETWGFLSLDKVRWDYVCDVTLILIIGVYWARSTRPIMWKDLTKG